MNVLELAVPDGWAEAVASIIITVLSWWLGRQQGINRAAKRRRKTDAGHRDP